MLHVSCNMPSQNADSGRSGETVTPSSSVNNHDRDNNLNRSLLVSTHQAEPAEAVTNNPEVIGTGAGSDEGLNEETGQANRWVCL